MKIAFIGQKGIPATWGGVEFHVDELARRLRDRDHDVTVYVRKWYTLKEIKEYQGVRLLHTPCINTKHLDAATHSLTSSLHTILNSYDIIHYHAMGPTLFSWIPRIFYKKVVATIHRFDYEAGKWSSFAQKFLKISEKFALNMPQKTIVVAKYQADFYRSKGYNLIYIPNGVNIPKKASPDIISKKYGLQGRDYIVSLGRLVPEKRIDWTIRAFKSLKVVGEIQKKNKNLKLIIAGGSSATDEYVKRLHKLADGAPDIIFTGYVKGRLKQELLSNAFLFVIPSVLEGLPIALLEAMSYELPCLASDIMAHREVVDKGSDGFLFHSDSFESFVNSMVEILSLPHSSLKLVSNNARLKVKMEYDWEKIVDATEAIYREIGEGKHTRDDG